MSDGRCVAAPPGRHHTADGREASSNKRARLEASFWVSCLRRVVLLLLLPPLVEDDLAFRMLLVLGVPSPVVVFSPSLFLEDDFTFLGGEEEDCPSFLDDDDDFDVLGDTVPTCWVEAGCACTGGGCVAPSPAPAWVAAGIHHDPAPEALCPCPSSSL